MRQRILLCPDRLWRTKQDTRDPFKWRNTIGIGNQTIPRSWDCVPGVRELCLVGLTELVKKRLYRTSKHGWHIWGLGRHYSRGHRRRERRKGSRGYSRGYKCNGSSRERCGSHGCRGWCYYWPNSFSATSEDKAESYTH